ncbi:TonB-dependent receptor plug domain-containing protein [Ochrobactrum pseudogrignonense]|nr:TonB-dependent receptor plug domain-containing protein [Brucella pseudogrignonensis]
MSISVIDRDTLDRHQVRDIQDMVRYEPGVSVDRQTSLTNPFGQLNSFNIRGVGGNRVQILVDVRVFRSVPPMAAVILSIRLI